MIENHDFSFFFKLSPGKKLELLKKKKFQNYFLHIHRNFLFAEYENNPTLENAMLLVIKANLVDTKYEINLIRDFIENCENKYHFEHMQRFFHK